jgi:ABC-2 type transport system ATP-binding protein
MEYHMNVITANQISKSFGSIQAVKQVSFELNGGEILGLIGPNGAGKTTTIRMILDIFKPDNGSISVFDGPMNENKKNLIGYLPEERGLYQDISLEKCLTYLAAIKGLDPEAIESGLNHYLGQFDLQDFRKKKVKEMSKGMQQKAQIIATFIHQPRLVIVDEPFSALDPVNTQLVKNLLLEEKARGTAIIMSTHQMNQAEELCDRILLVNKGQIMLAGRLNDIRRQFARPELLVRSSAPLPETISGVKRIETENSHQRLFLEPGSTPQQVLKEIINQGFEVEQFEIAEPSLDEIFIEVVTGKGNAQ